MAADLAVLAGFGGAVFQPWRAFLDGTVTEVAPGGTPARALASGDFVSLAHGTSGRISVQETDGTAFLRIEDLDTSAARADTGRWVELGPLGGSKGSLTYPLPVGTDPAAFRSVVLWCNGSPSPMVPHRSTVRTTQPLPAALSRLQP